MACSTISNPSSGTISAVSSRGHSAYFTTFDGRRTAFFVFDMPDSSAIPPFAEPFFQELEAEVPISPVMDGDDLQKGLSGMA